MVGDKTFKNPSILLAYSMYLDYKIYCSNSLNGKACEYPYTLKKPSVKCLIYAINYIVQYK